MKLVGYDETVEFLRGLFPGVASIDVKQCAQVLGCSVNSVYASVNYCKNPIPSKRVRGKITIPIPGLARWMCTK